MNETGSISHPPPARLCAGRQHHDVLGPCSNLWLLLHQPYSCCLSVASVDGSRVCPPFPSSLPPPLYSQGCLLNAQCTGSRHSPNLGGKLKDSQQGTPGSCPCSFHFFFCLVRLSFTLDLPCLCFSPWQHLLVFQDLAQAILGLKFSPSWLGPLPWHLSPCILSRLASLWALGTQCQVLNNLRGS